MGVAAVFLTGEGAILGAGGSGVTLGAGGSINWDSISTGTTISAARSNRPLCRAHINPTCSKTTASAIAALRLKGGGFFTRDLDAAGRPSEGMAWGTAEEVDFMFNGANRGANSGGLLKNWTNGPSRPYKPA